MHLPPTTLSTLLALKPPILSPGCHTPQPLPQDLVPGGPSLNLTLSSSLSSPNTTHQTRHYNLHLPQSYIPTTPLPLILIYHGQGQNTTSIERYTLFSTAQPDSITVYPAGVNNQFLGDPVAPPSTEINDIQFTSDLLDHLTSTYCIDTSRVYAAGFSNGGGLTGLLACNSTVGSRFAALAGVAAAHYPDEQLSEPLFGEGCVGGGKVPYLEIHGTNDKIIDYQGHNGDQPASIPLPEWMGKMARLNNCTPTAAGTGGLIGFETNSTQVLNGGNVTRYSWSCDGREDVVVHYKVEGLGHGWPGTVAVGGILDEYRGGPTSWNATEVVRGWFGRWTRGSGFVEQGEVEAFGEFVRGWTYEG
ncbi:hypothetical protein PRZ48_009305 [Zasmidium cellare]|uniref:feruloyl esterase n=1 Tax=Zasmidium cellare TaxID=395010 RepID=A0ABR0ECB9_ZASCE|nr:hypothetical protein PRZ48_009305 [Zasmidium cellare]